jgi:small subunit ribosomal protein S1
MSDAAQTPATVSNPETEQGQPEAMPMSASQAAFEEERLAAESAAQASSSETDEEPHPPVDPEIAPKIDPDPEFAPVTEPGPEPEPVHEPEPQPDEEPEPAPDPEPLPGKQHAQAAPAPEKSAIEMPVTEKPIDPKIDPVVDQEIGQELAHEPEQPEESFADIFSEFQRSHSRREPGSGSQIRGTIVAVTVDSVLVDIGYKSEGILPLGAFASHREPPKPGDTLQVSVKGRDADGYYELSLFKTAQPKDWSSLERAFADKSTIVGTVTGVVKGGLHVDVGIRAFLPASRSGARDAAEMEKLIGQEIRVRITKLDVADEDLVVDRRVVTEEEALESKARRHAEIEEGAVVDGTVRSLAEYGAFVDLGGVDGLLHISDIAWSRVANVADVLTIGQQIEVKVLKIDRETGKISLGLKQLQPHPWDSVAEKFVLGDRVRGVVSRIADFGAFVELSPGVEGLVHLSEMSWSKRIHKATEVVNTGDVIDAVILAINIPERRISLGLKQALGDPWVEAAARLAPGSEVEGPVASITKFGAFIQVSEGVEGLVHISEIVPDRRLNHPSDVLRVGQVVRALVLDLDKEKRQLRLSMKQLIPTSLDEFLAEHKAGDAVTGRIASIENGIARVELGEGILCTCKLPTPAAPEPAPAADNTPQSASSGKVDLSAFSSMLKTKWKTGSSPADAAASKSKASEAAKAGQVRNFKIVAIDAGAKRVTLELVN